VKIVRYSSGGGARVGVLDDGVLRDAGTSIFDARPSNEVGKARLLAPVDDVRNIVCVGLNYRKHAEEGGQPIPDNPILFSKFSNSIVGPGEDIRIPPITSQVDYEAELGVVMRRRASAVSVDRALDYVLGYTCINDVSARDVQFADRQWVRGKALDTFCPIGPCIVTTDEITDPQTLGIRCRVNGATLQDSNTADMIFGVAEIVSFISQGITLEPGDIIATGTPEGVGFARTPPIYLAPGDVVDVEIDGIGTLSNPVTAR
jgi:2-keto-4-pentenoate hydratase/2-oxohepta-3-ene-1,7-dioic acid hydratase in catechol pathway